MLRTINNENICKVKNNYIMQIYTTLRTIR